MGVEISAIGEVVGAGEGSEEVVGSGIDGGISDDEQGGG